MLQCATDESLHARVWGLDSQCTTAAASCCALAVPRHNTQAKGRMQGSGSSGGLLSPETSVALESRQQATALDAHVVLAPTGGTTAEDAKSGATCAFMPADRRCLLDPSADQHREACQKG